MELYSLMKKQNYITFWNFETKINQTQKSRNYSFFSVVDPNFHRHKKTHHHHAHTHTIVHTPSLYSYIVRCESKKQAGEER